MTTESDPVPKDAPTAILRQNSYVAHMKGMIPMMNTMIVVVGLSCSICRVSTTCASDTKSVSGGVGTSDVARSKFDKSMLLYAVVGSIAIRGALTLLIASLLKGLIRWCNDEGDFVCGVSVTKARPFGRAENWPQDTSGII